MDTEPGRLTRTLSGSLHVQRHRFDEVDHVPMAGQPFRVASDAAPNISDRSVGMEEARDDLLRSLELKCADAMC
jgi:hypothetical protein